MTAVGLVTKTLERARATISNPTSERERVLAEMLRKAFDFLELDLIGYCDALDELWEELDAIAEE